MTLHVDTVRLASVSVTPRIAIAIAGAEPLDLSVLEARLLFSQLGLTLESLDVDTAAILAGRTAKTAVDADEDPAVGQVCVLCGARIQAGADSNERTLRLQAGLSMAEDPTHFWVHAACDAAEQSAVMQRLRRYYHKTQAHRGGA